MDCSAPAFWLCGRRCVFLQKLVSVSGWLVGIVTEGSHVFRCKSLKSIEV